MDSTKKSVLGIERKNKIRRLTIRFLKETKTLLAFREYISTSNYQHFNKSYALLNGVSQLWYDRSQISDVLGCCNFGYFLHTIHNDPNDYLIYDLFIIFLFMFDYDEGYLTYCRKASETPIPKYDFDKLIIDYPNHFLIEYIHKWKKMTRRWNLLVT